MSAWRNRAGQELPEVWRDEQARETPHLLFFELLPVVREAHKSGDRDLLGRAYAFAHWCFDRGGDLGNAAAVSFYEHLFDAWDIHQDVLGWLDPRILRECWPLFEARLDAEKLAVLRARMSE